MFYPLSAIDSAPPSIKRIFKHANEHNGLSFYGMAVTMVIRDAKPSIVDPRYVPESLEVLLALQAEGTDLERVLSGYIGELEVAYNDLIGVYQKNLRIA